MQLVQPKVESAILFPEDFKPFLSSYITGGYREDISVLEKVIFKKDEEIEGFINMEKFYVSKDTNEFHLSVPIAMLWIFQLAIIYGCQDTGMDEKKGEHYMREMNLKCKKEITKTNFSIKINSITRKDLGSRIFYGGKLSVDQGSFQGYATFIMPKF